MTETTEIKWQGVEQAKQFLINIDELIPDPDNANTHPKENLEAIAKSLERFGQDQFLIVRKSDMAVIKGNGRMTAAKEILGWTHLACIVVDDDKATSIARSLADNRTSELSRWDFSMLQNNFNDLIGLDFNLNDIGFDEAFYGPLIAADFVPGIVDPNAASGDTGNDDGAGGDDKQSKQMVVLFEDDEDYNIVWNAIEFLCHRNKYPLPDENDNMAIYLTEICKELKR